MAKSKPRVKVPKKAEAGEIITIKTLISHKMESGQRKKQEKLANSYRARSSITSVPNLTASWCLKQRSSLLCLQTPISRSR